LAARAASPTEVSDQVARERRSRSNEDASDQAHSAQDFKRLHPRRTGGLCTPNDESVVTAGSMLSDNVRENALAAACGS
jgi:hypothetical protein